MASLLFNFEWDIPLFWRFGASFKWQAGSFVLDNKWNLSRCNPASNFERIIWDNRGKPIQIIETWHCSFSHKGLPSSRIKGVSNITKKNAEDIISKMKITFTSDKRHGGLVNMTSHCLTKKLPSALTKVFQLYKKL